MYESQKDKRKRLFLNAVDSLQLENPNAEIADTIGYDRGNLSRILNGNIAPSRAVVKRFEDAFQISIEDFELLEPKKNSIEEVRIESFIAKLVAEQIALHLKDSQNDHLSSGRQVDSITESLNLLTKRINDLHNKVDRLEETLVNNYCSKTWFNNEKMTIITPMFPADFYTYLKNHTLIEIKGGSTRETFLPIWMVTVDGRVFARSWNKSEKSWFTEFLNTGLGEIKTGDRVLQVSGKKVSPDDPINPKISEAYLRKYDQPGNLKYSQGISQPEYFDHTMEFFVREA